MKLIILLFVFGIISPVFAQETMLSDAQTQLDNQINFENLEKFEERITVLENYIKNEENTFGIEAIVIAVVTPMVGSVMVIITWHYHRINLHYNSLMKTFDWLSDKEHWKARRNVIQSFEKFIRNETPDLILFDEEDLRIVRSDYDQIGNLVYKKINDELMEKKNIDKKFGKYWSTGYLVKEQFFEEYSGSVINCWLAMNYVVEFQRKHEFSSRFMLFFEKLYQDAVEYRKQHYSDLVTPVQEKWNKNEKIKKWITEIPHQNKDELKKLRE